MAIFLQLLLGVIAVTLVVYEIRVARPTDLRLSEERSASKADVSPGIRVGGVLGVLFGFLNFPATLAPVVLVALAAQQHPIGGDGTTALIGIVVAGFSMSASLKAIRAGEIYARGQLGLYLVARQSVLYVLGWTAMVSALLALAPAPTGRVALLVYGYAALTFFVALALKLTDGRAQPAESTQA